MHTKVAPSVSEFKYSLVASILLRDDCLIIYVMHTTFLISSRFLVGLTGV